MTSNAWLLVASGAAFGAPCRLLVDAYVEHHLGKRLAVGTLAVNAIGSFLLGVATALLIEGGLSADMLLLIGTGFCGAFTTFSTFSLEVVTMLERRETADGVAVIASNTIASIALAAGGYALILGVG
jgi:fluoride exporter